MSRIGVLGDSQVKFLNQWNQDIIVHSFSGRQVQDLEKYAKRLVPSIEILILHVCTNNISDKSQCVADIIGRVERLITVCQAANPTVQMYFSSVLPRFDCKFTGNGIPADLNERAALFNKGVLPVCQKRGVLVLPLWELFQDRTLVGRDGLHLSMEGNKLLAKVYSESGLIKFSQSKNKLEEKVTDQDIHVEKNIVKSIESSTGGISVCEVYQNEVKTITFEGIDGKTLCIIQEINGETVWKVKRGAGLTVVEQIGKDGQSTYILKQKKKDA